MSKRVCLLNTSICTCLIILKNVINSVFGILKFFSIIILTFHWFVNQIYIILNVRRTHKLCVSDTHSFYFHIYIYRWIQIWFFCPCVLMIGKFSFPYVYIFLGFTWVQKRTEDQTCDNGSIYFGLGLLSQYPLLYDPLLIGLGLLCFKE